jgi:hypothetical protein
MSTSPKGATLAAPLAPEVQLGNKGGAITLLDPPGSRSTAVAYAEGDLPDEGWTIVF